MNHKELTDALKEMDNHICWNQKRQQQVRMKIISEINQIEEKQVTPNSRMTRVVAPLLAIVLIIGIAATLIMSELSTDEFAGENGQTAAVAEKIQYDIEESFMKDIQQIIDSGFDLRLPTYSLGDSMAVNGVVHRREETHVAINYSYEGKEIFNFWQETGLNEVDWGKEKERFEQIKSEATNQYDVNGRSAYMTENPETGAKGLHLMTEQYGFSIFSSELSDEQMLQLVSSIDLSEID